MEFLLASTRSKWTKKNKISTVVGAFDFKTTKAAAAFSLGRRMMPSKIYRGLKDKIEKSGATMGCADESIYGEKKAKFGHCAEFQAANKVLLRPGGQEIGTPKRNWDTQENIDKNPKFT